MIEILGVQIGMTWLGLSGLVIGALVLGLLGQFFGTVETSYEWVPDAIAAFIGAFIGSEALDLASTWGPQWEGVYLAPAAIGAVVALVIVDAVVRWSTGGTFTGHAHPA